MADKLRVYGQWAGNPKGTPENPSRCIESIWSGMRGRQCSRSRGHGPDSLYCKQHDPVAVKAKTDAKYDKFKQDCRIRRKNRERSNILSDMASGIKTEDLHKYKLVRDGGMNE